MTNDSALSPVDLTSVTGGRGVCRVQADGQWHPTPPNRTLAGRHGFDTRAQCTAGVKQWQNSLMNIDNDRAD